MRPPIPRIGLRWRSAAICLLVLTSISIGTVRADAATYPNPGVVTGAITGVHDPAMIKAPNGTYILVSTGNWLEIRTSADRTAFTKVATYAASSFGNLLGWDSAGWPYVY